MLIGHNTFEEICYFGNKVIVFEIETAVTVPFMTLQKTIISQLTAHNITVVSLLYKS